MKNLFFYIIVYFAFLFSTGHAGSLLADLSDHSITISTSFTGRDVLLFGSSDGRGDIIVVVKGPKHDLKIRKKEKNYGIWLNNDYVYFKNVPSYYAVASNKELEDILPPHIRKRHQIGAYSLTLDYEVSSKKVESNVPLFQNNMITLFQKKQLYFPKLNKIHYRGEQLFRTTLTFPAHVPTGTYDVEVYQIEGGRLINAQTTPLIIQKIGLEARLYNWAVGHSLLYGVFAVIIAFLIGWLSTIIIRKSR